MSLTPTDPHVDDPTVALAQVPPAEPRRRRRTRNVLIGLVVTVLLLIGAAAAAVYGLSEHIGNNVSRVPNVFGGLNVADRPAAGPGLTFLLVGTDSRSTEPTTGSDAPAGVNAGSQRSDVIMLAQIAADRQSASVVSIPRDSYVDIPGRGKNKINAAYAFGGAPLLVQTVEQLTGVRVDHFGVIDFAGFQGMVDSVGGIDVKIKEATQNFGVSFTAGENHLDGKSALAYVRQRYDLPGGDLDRAKRQQNALRALLQKVATGSVLSNPAELYGFLDATSRNVSIDDTMTNGDFRSLALDSRSLRPSGVTFLSARVSGFGREQGGMAVDYLDTAAGTELWSAFRTGDLQQYAATHPNDKLGDVPA